MRTLFTALLLAASCAGAGPAAAETLAERALAFQSRVDEAARAMEESPRMHDLSLDRRRGLVQFVAGNMLYVLLHEMGHVHITEMGLPVLGRDEDAADSFAVVTMLKIGNAMSDDVLVDAATGWFLSALRDEKEGVKLEFYDAHGLDRQRAFQIVCLMVGSDPQRFKTLADRIAMPPERQSTCRGDYSNASWSWNTLMKPHLRAADQPKTPITVTYQKAEGDLVAIEKSFRAIRLLETVADQSSDEYVWRRPFTLEMKSCGAAGGDWDIATQKVVLCYEFAADLAMLYRKYGAQVQLPMYRAATP